MSLVSYEICIENGDKVRRVPALGIEIGGTAFASRYVGEDRWSLDHRPTGCRILDYPTFEDARDAALKLAAEPLDWTSSDPEFFRGSFHRISEETLAEVARRSLLPDGRAGFCRSPLLDFMEALEAFLALRDQYRDEATAPDRERIQTLSSAAQLVLGIVPPFEALGKVPFPESCYRALLEELEFTADPTKFLKEHGTYSTAVDGSPITLTELGGEVLVVERGEAVRAAVGDEHVHPVKGGVQ